LVLLVIFMVTAPMITPGTIDLPTVGQASEVPAAPIEVQVDTDGVLSIRLRDGSAEFHNISKENLVDEVRLLALNENPVVIAADGQVPYETDNELEDQLRSNSIIHLSFLVNQNDE